jgi:hypothetical protein
MRIHRVTWTSQRNCRHAKNEFSVDDGVVYGGFRERSSGRFCKRLVATIRYYYVETEVHGAGGQECAVSPVQAARCVLASTTMTAPLVR